MVSKWLSERLPRDACLLVSLSVSFVISMSSSLAQFPILSMLPVGECGTEQPAFALALLESVPFIVSVGCFKLLLMLPGGNGNTGTLFEKELVEEQVVGLIETLPFFNAAFDILSLGLFEV